MPNINNKNNNEPAYPHPVYAWYVVAVLFLAYTLSLVDRQIMSLLVEPIKRDLAISDTQFSLLHGFAFAIFYTVLGLPLGYLADRKNRCFIIAAGIFVWSFMTALCGLAKNFWFLFLARIGVGVGEAALSPAAYSIISDYFPKEKRGIAVSLYSMAIFVGIGLAYIIGGIVVQIASQTHETVLPIIGQVRSWQLTFFIVGIPGLFMTMLMFTVKEPYRRDILHTGSNHQDQLSIRATIGYLLKHGKTYGFLILALGLLAAFSYGIFAWIPSLFIRTFSWKASEIGFAFGSIVLVMGTLGAILGGILADKMYSNGKTDAYLRVCLISAAGLLVFGTPAALMPNANGVLLLFTPVLFFIGMTIGMGPAALNLITPNQMRGQAIALYLFSTSLLGLSLGPTTVAVITDYIFEDTYALPYSITIFAGVVSIITIITLLLTMKPYRDSVKINLTEEI